MMVMPKFCVLNTELTRKERAFCHVNSTLHCTICDIVGDGCSRIHNSTQCLAGRLMGLDECPTFVGWGGEWATSRVEFKAEPRAIPFSRKKRVQRGDKREAWIRKGSDERRTYTKRQGGAGSTGDEGEGTNYKG